MPRSRAAEKLVQTTPGSRVGSYEIVEPLGAGAMGNVYRATDHRLGRDVALKALPDSLAHDDEALARFEREARFLASLNHPNIAAIYGIEESGTERFLVLELVPGETLEQVLKRGAVPVDRALRIAIQVAAALEAAHDAEIIHRDLKPSNVKTTPDGRVKLLDFGIAKYAAPHGGIDVLSADRSLTLTGTMVGTPQYMSPEQVFGEPVDRRTDVWAFGCLLYELLTGRVAFPGHSIIEIADAVRSRDPDWSALPRDTPADLQRLVARCLRKDPHERLHHMGDARVELEEITAEHAPATRRSSRTFAIAAAAAFAAAVTASAIPVLRRALFPPAAAGPIRFTQLTSAEGIEQFPAWSPDGKSIVFAGDVGGIRKLFIKQVGSSDQERLTAGDQDDLQPAWSPDGRRILFVRARETHRRLEPGDVFGNYESDNADVWSIDLQTRHESRFVQNAYYPSFSPNGRTVAVDASWAGPRRIWTVDERGFNPQQITSDSSEAVTHVLPRWSPDGTRIVYQRVERTKFDIALVDVRRRQSVAVTNDNYRKINPVWAGDGRAIYFSSDRGGGMNLWRLEIDGENKVVGPPRQLTSGAGQDVQIAVSPDGNRLAYSTLRQNADVWRLPLTPEGTAAGQPEQVIATTREDSRGAWSPDGKQIAFNSDRAGDMNLWIHSLEDHGTRQVTRGPGGDFQPSWSPDATQLAFFSSRAGKTDIWTVDLPSARLTRLTHSRSLDINPFFSPDGKQIVFESDASGRLELWLMDADGTRLHQLTDIGVSGHFIRWLRDGNIYFRSPTRNAIMRVTAAGGEPQVASPDGGAHISFSPDGSRFIDVKGHKVLWLYSFTGPPKKLFEFPDPEVRIDYPVWSPDGTWLLFDRFRPEGGDVWMAEGIR